MMKIVMIYPEIRNSFFGYKHILPYINKKSVLPPLGLLTIAALLPKEHDVTLVDMNTGRFHENCLRGADLVFVSVAAGQKNSFDEVMEILRGANVPILIGGPYPTSFYRKENPDILFATVSGADHYCIGEAETVFPEFMKDFERGTAARVYVGERIDMSLSPVPRYDLIDVSRYAGMAIQFSRGCPFNCEFCEITYLFGKKVRTKSAAQVIREMDMIFEAGFRGSLFIVDDNFIMETKKVKPLLARMIEWQRTHGYPFHVTIQASINMSSDEELLSLLVEAGITTAFIGIESPHENSLIEMSKHQNRRINLHDEIRKIQSRGIEVTAGFIVGFDSDPDEIFDMQIDFIQNSGIVKAMVGLLQLSPNTRLYHRLKGENRILEDIIPTNNTHHQDLNYVPRIGKERLVEGYHRILEELYRPRNYFKRGLDLMKRMSRGSVPRARIHGITIRSHVLPFFRILLRQTFSGYGLHYWNFLIRIMLFHSRTMPKAFVLASMGHHFFKMNEEIIERQIL